MSDDDRNQALPDSVLSARAKWNHDGRSRPDFAIAPGPGEESVWDYPRPPSIVPDSREVVVEIGGHEVARSRKSVRVLETASPPTFYLPPDAIRLEFFERASGSSHCEWKGDADYWSTRPPVARVERVAWSYPRPYPEFASIAGWFSFYPGLAECSVAGIRVAPQPGKFYAGWVTPELVGPFKGEPGSRDW